MDWVRVWQLGTPFVLSKTLIFALLIGHTSVDSLVRRLSVTHYTGQPDSSKISELRKQSAR